MIATFILGIFKLTEYFYDANDTEISSDTVYISVLQMEEILTIIINNFDVTKIYEKFDNIEYSSLIYNQEVRKLALMSG